MALSVLAGEVLSEKFSGQSPRDPSVTRRFWIAVGEGKGGYSQKHLVASNKLDFCLSGYFVTQIFRRLLFIDRYITICSLNYFSR